MATMPSRCPVNASRSIRRRSYEGKVSAAETRGYIPAGNNLCLVLVIFEPVPKCAYTSSIWFNSFKDVEASVIAQV